MLPETRQSLTSMNGSQRERGSESSGSPALTAAAGALSNDGLARALGEPATDREAVAHRGEVPHSMLVVLEVDHVAEVLVDGVRTRVLRSEEHTSELQSPDHLVCR